MAQNSPFSFHCMICFEEFTLDDRYPVVLPCGHTYVCCQCAQRLEKCMECRTPLYYYAPPENNFPSSPTASLRSNNGWSNNGRHRVGPAEHNHDPHNRRVKKRLPLPKNVVLLSLVEVTALSSSHDDWGKYSDSPRQNSELKAGVGVEEIRNLGSMIDDDDEEDDEEEKIKMGTSLAVGVAGTYAVAEKEGLEIYPSRPAMQEQSVSLADEDIDTLLRISDSKDGSSGVESPARLSYGDRVQIVTVDSGWAKLARGYGYVKADRQQLVKVGNSLDRACKLEAILRNLSKRKNELRLEQSDIDNQFIRMLNSLQTSMEHDEDLTVIVAATFAGNTLDDTSELEAFPSSTNTEACSRDAVAERDATDIQKAQIQQRPPTPPFQNARLTCFAGPLFGANDDSDNYGGDRATLPDMPTSSLLDFMPHQTTLGAILPSISHPSPSAMRAGAQAWRERQGQIARGGSSSGGINFRTGMSGHMGVLLGNQTRHPHEYLEDHYQTSSAAHQIYGQHHSVSHSSAYSNNYRPSYSGRLRMSSHTGLSSVRSKPSPVGTTSILDSFTPMLMRPSSTTSSRAEESRDQLHQAGSF